MKKRKYIILGSDGFLGNNLFEYLTPNGYNVESFNKRKLNFLLQKSFAVTNFSGTTIFDCISRINGNDEEIEAVNNKGFENFINFLKKNHNDFTYIYFSTLSTLYPTLIESNKYIRSKYEAECFLKSQGVDYKIIRLTFPIGKGESANRLFPRLIHKLKVNEDITIDRIKMNITPINSLLEWISDLLKSDKKEINFTDGQVYQLFDVVHYLAKKIASASKISYNDQNEIDIIFRSFKEGMNFKSAVYNTLDEMLYGN